MSVVTVISFLAIALLYSAAGLGGGSSYLAILSLTDINYSLIRPIALVCNLAVVSGSMAVHIRSGNLKLPRTALLVVLSIPAAFVGGMMRLEERLFFVVLGSALVTAGVAMIAQLSWNLLRKRSEETTAPSEESEAGPMKKHTGLTTIVAGAGVGLLSGLVGIGGGIFLSPLLHLTRWAPPREITAATSFFIAVNSAAGLLGLLVTGFPSGLISGQGLPIIALLVAVVAGGQIGSRLTSRVLPPGLIRIVTAGLVMFVGMRVLIQ